MAHREGIREYLSGVKLYGVVHDWGCGTKPITKYLESDLSKDQVVYVGIDKEESVNPTIIADIEEPLTLDTRAQLNFCLEVLEHTWNAGTLLMNIWNNTRKGGVLYLSQPFLYPVHKEDDRVRYTYHGLVQLLEEFGWHIEDIQTTSGNMDDAEGYIVRAIK